MSRHLTDRKSKTELSPMDYCLGMLEGMNSGKGQDFDAQYPLFLAVLSLWPEDLAKRVVLYAVLNLEWRPAPAVLRQIAAKLESPLPPVDDCLLEVRAKMRRFGINAAPHPMFPDNPRITTIGPPSFSHPIVDEIVRGMGGWERLFQESAQFQEGGFDGTFRSIYERQGESWRDRVIDCLDNGTRPSVLFPNWRPFDETALPGTRVTVVSRPALPEPVPIASIEAYSQSEVNHS